MQKAIALIFFLLICIYQTNAFSLFSNSCPESPIIKDFDADKYLGLWYEIERFPARFEKDLSCVTAKYTKLNDSIQVKNYGFNLKKNKESVALGTATLPNSDEPNRLKVSFSVKFLGLNLNTPSGEYNVWSTDYVNYSLVYSCSKFLFIKNEYAWILSRTKVLDESQMDNLKAILESKGINVGKFEKVEQTCDN